MTESHASQDEPEIMPTRMRPRKRVDYMKLGAKLFDADAVLAEAADEEEEWAPDVEPQRTHAVTSPQT